VSSSELILIILHFAKLKTDQLKLTSTIYTVVALWLAIKLMRALAGTFVPGAQAVACVSSFELGVVSGVE